MATFSFLGNDQDGSNAVSYTFSSQPLGVVHTARRIVLLVGNRQLTNTRPTIAATIAGVSAVQHESVKGTDSASNSSYASIFSAEIPTGASGDVVVEFDRTQLRCGIGLYQINSRLDPASSTFVAGGQSNVLHSVTGVPSQNTIAAIVASDGQSGASLSGINLDDDISLEGVSRLFCCSDDSPSDSISFLGSGASNSATAIAVASFDQFAPINLVAPALSITQSEFTGTVGTWDNQSNGTLTYIWQLRQASDDTVVASGTGTTISGSGTFSGGYYLWVRCSNDGGYNAEQDQSTFAYVGLLGDEAAAWIASLDDRGNTTATLYDYSGGNNHLTLTNGPTWDADTGSGGVRALNHDGSNDYTLGNAVGVFADHEFTISLRCKFPTITANDYVFSVGSSTAGNPYVAFYHSAADQLRAYYRDDTGTLASNASDLIATVGTDTWYHVVLIADGSKVRFYLDGLLVNVADRSDVPGGSMTVDQICLGALARTSISNHADVLVDDVRIFDREINATELAKLASQRAYLESGAVVEASITLAGVTASSSASSPVSADAAISLGGVAAASTASATVAGAVSASLDGVTSMATGESSIVAGSAVALDGVTTSAEASSQVVGSASITLDGVTVFASTSSGSVGDLAVQLDGVTITAAGSSPVTAAAGLLLGGVVATSTASARLEGDASITLGGVVTEATAAAPIAGGVSVALDGVTVTAIFGGRLVESFDLFPDSLFPDSLFPSEVF